MDKFLLLLILILVAFLPARAAENHKDKVAVMNFQMQGGPYENQDTSAFVAELLVTMMVRDGRFNVIERQLLDKVLSEQKLAMTGVVDSENAAQLGNILGANIIVTGSILKARHKLTINARIIEVESASVIAAETVDDVDPQNMQKSITGLAAKLLSHFSFHGYIVNRHERTATIDLGADRGIQPGMHFTVYSEGSPLIHPNTGEIIGKETLTIGSLAVVSVMDRTSLVEITDETEPGIISYGSLIKSVNATTPESTLNITTQPTDSRIRILNIAAPFKQNMILPPGTYLVDVSAHGYHAKRISIIIKEGEKSNQFIRLEKQQAKDIQSIDGYVRQQDGTVLDTEANVLWLIKTEGIMSWEDAQRYLKKVNQQRYLGHADWRIPNKEELLRAARFAKNHPGFFQMDDAWTWSSTKNGPMSAWAVNMGHAKPAWDDFDESSNSKNFELPFAVRLIRKNL